MCGIADIMNNSSALPLPLGRKFCYFGSICLEVLGLFHIFANEKGY